jgi:hypothetical protein
MSDYSALVFWYEHPWLFAAFIWIYCLGPYVIAALVVCIALYKWWVTTE